ncbi:hypothetical protein AVEN_126024-1 [Araneus ventricosus]|uniref:Uncharacterized protein n=1 Tax=Araneus ventricosus TaxID=182803 RepID=A0A4Y2NIT5_ARAVE|nr:hypothetical protein AVEN_126024-1 [Araneus ventricosus]
MEPIHKKGRFWWCPARHLESGGLFCQTVEHAVTWSWYSVTCPSRFDVSDSSSATLFLLNSSKTSPILKRRRIANLEGVNQRADDLYLVILFGRYFRWAIGAEIPNCDSDGAPNYSSPEC